MNANTNKIESSEVMAAGGEIIRPMRRRSLTVFARPVGP